MFVKCRDLCSTMRSFTRRFMHRAFVHVCYSVRRSVHDESICIFAAERGVRNAQPHVVEEGTMRTRIWSTIRWSAAIGATLGALAGCDSATGVCTLIGCANPLTVHLTAAPIGPFQVDLLVNGAVQQTVLRTGPTNCVQDVSFRTAPTDHVAIRVSTFSGIRVTEFAKITYTHQQVNGPDCPPDCLSATITAQVPA
jgi:hypothetical protein